MDYFNFYKTICKSGKKYTYKKEACFSAIYRNINDYKYIYLYIRKGEFPVDVDHYYPGNKEILKKYVYLLNKLLNIKIKIKKDVCRIIKFGDINDIANYYNIEIPINDDAIKIKIALNALRFLYERNKEDSIDSSKYTFYSIVTTFLKLHVNVKLKKVSLANKFLLALTISKSYNDGHSILPHGPLRIITDEEWNTILNKKNNNNYVCSVLSDYKIKLYDENMKGMLYTLLNNRKYYKAYTYIVNYEKSKKEDLNINKKELIPVEIPF